VLWAVDELLAGHVISERTWAALSLSYDERQLIELPFLVGHYVMVAYVMRSMGVELEPGQAGFELRG
jgi:alkylhydroperoxidase family enzyme